MHITDYKRSDDFDVVILGSGFSGSVMATVLARQGVSVLVLDAKAHPRFAIGESTTPQTSQLISLLAGKYNVPELKDCLGSPLAIQKRIGCSSGIKRVFGFAYHETGREHDPAKGIQFGNIWRDENHLFRQDIDMYLAKLAVTCGAELRENTRVEQLEFRADEVFLLTSNGDQVRAQYVVDATGFRSVLAEKYHLRENPPRFKHHSRTIFTHLRQVRPFEECVDNWLSVDWSKGTLHHLFDGGWMWIIPFNNHAESTNPIVSVGLTLDTRQYPPNDLGPDAEFKEFLSRLPSVARQFTEAAPVRPWIKTGRVQYSSSQSVGHRYCLLAHAAGFVDPMFSRGLTNTLEIIDKLVDTLLCALNERDFSLERFKPIEALQNALLDYSDRLINGSYISWSNFDVWNAWMRIWAISTGVVESNMGSYLIMGEKSFWKPTENPIFSRFEDQGYRDFFEGCESVILQFDEGELSAAETADLLFARIQAYDFHMPIPNGSRSHEWALKNPNCRDFYIGKESLHARWSARQSDPRIY